MRCFIALSFGDFYSMQLRQVMQEYRAERAFVRWIDPEHAHVTLHFFADLSEKMVLDVRQHLHDAVKGVPPFFVRLGDLGCFQSKCRPRTIWLSIIDRGRNIEQLHGKISSRLSGFGLPVERRRFVPHLTIGRVKNVGDDREFLENIQSYVIPTMPEFQLCEIVLFKSVLTREGPEYTVLETVPLLG